MQTKQIFPISKIAFLILLLSFGLIAGILFFHWNKPRSPTLSSDKGFLLPVPREITPFKLETADQQQFTVKNFLNHWTLLFFGFTHCSNVCPTTLDMMNKAYDNLKKDLPNLQVVLISLDPERDTPETLARYAQTFNPNFIGVTGKIQEIRKLQSQLGIAAMRDPQSGNNYQLQHTSSILLINPAGKWAGMVKYGLNPTEFTKIIKESVRLVS